MQTIITMKYNEKFHMPSIYAERYGIICKEISRKNEDIFINVPVDEYITDSRTVRIIGDIVSDILRAEPVACYVADDIAESNSLIKIELALVDCYMKKSDKKHYSREVRNFYQRHGIIIDEYLPETEYNDNGSCMLVSCTANDNKKISVVRNFSFEYLYDVCELYRDFVDDKKLDIEELYLIASNLRIVGGGKRKFLETVIWAGLVVRCADIKIIVTTATI